MVWRDARAGIADKEGVLQIRQDMMVAGARTMLVKKESSRLLHDLLVFWVCNNGACWLTGWEEMKTIKEDLTRRLLSSEILSVCYRVKYKSSISYYLKQNIPKWENIPIHIQRMHQFLFFETNFNNRIHKKDNVNNDLVTSSKHQVSHQVIKKNDLFQGNRKTTR